MAKIYVGMSGWTYPGWRGGFYPKGLVHKKELHYASRQVNSIEINGTFYSLQKPESFQRWHDDTPDDFVFAVKAPQYITHVKRLKDVDEPLATFFGSGLLCLKEKMGPILWQFPPNVMLKDDRFEKFLKMLPFDSKSAGRLAKKHGAIIEGRSFTKVSGDYPVRHAFEFRNDSFMNEGFIELLREYGVAVVFAHSGEKSPYTEDLTADFIYMRMHGQEAKYKKGYTAETLNWLSKRVSQWTHGSQPADAHCVSKAKPKKIARDAFVYFDNEAKDYAPHDAQALCARLKIKMPRAG
jgi:uncharacterized protein YecE (DUF72 family)